VILRTPVLPVTEGQTSVCPAGRGRPPTSDLPADFYRNDSPVGGAARITVYGRNLSENPAHTRRTDPDLLRLSSQIDQFS